MARKINPVLGKKGKPNLEEMRLLRILTIQVRKINERRKDAAEELERIIFTISAVLVEAVRTHSRDAKKRAKRALVYAA